MMPKQYADLSAGAELNFRILQGTDATIRVKYSVSTPRDLTGYTFQMRIRKAYKTEILATITPVGTVTNGNTEIVATITALQSLGFPVGLTAEDLNGQLVYDLVGTSSTGKKEGILRGVIQVIPTVQ
jgi:hypothetical protein